MKDEGESLDYLQKVERWLDEARGYYDSIFPSRFIEGEVVEYKGDAYDVETVLPNATKHDTYVIKNSEEEKKVSDHKLRLYDDRTNTRS